MAWTAADIADQRGRTAVITGANTGVGYETALALAAAGALTVLACRDRTRANDAAERIRPQCPDATVEVLPLDLADLAAVRAAAEEAHDRFERIDLLINNAGVMVPPLTRTADGFELQLGVNHLGHFAFTALVFGSPILSVASHPGVSYTELNRHSAGYGIAPVRAVIATAAKLVTHDVASAALPSLRAATDPGAAQGAYYGPDGRGGRTGDPVIVTSNERSHDVESARRLWEITEQLTGIQFPVTPAS
ncbi:MAG: SDR family NAD(P)-dependent oxidoreductase [Actinobacteria bacterium]|nr:SDR family NAD(P)-dependent oxidoreductase [Actinomycetota bacterium]